MPRLSEHREILRRARALEAAALQSQGWSLRDIAKKLHVDQRTIQRDLDRANAAFAACPELQVPHNSRTNVIPLRRQG